MSSMERHKHMPMSGYTLGLLPIIYAYNNDTVERRISRVNHKFNKRITRQLPISIIHPDSFRRITLFFIFSPKGAQALEEQNYSRHP
jgi:hypothetical protein